MLSYFFRNKTKDLSPDTSPIISPFEIQKTEDLVYAETFAKLSSELKLAQQQINSLLEQKNTLEAQLLAKEKENLLLLEQIASLTSNYSEEKNTLLQRQKDFLEEEKALLEKISNLQTAVSAKETECQKLLEKIPSLEAVVHQKIVLEEQNKIQQEQNQALLKRISEMEVTKRRIEYEFAQEKIAHSKTRSLYEQEKSSHLEDELSSAVLEDDETPSSSILGLFSQRNKKSEIEQPYQLPHFYHGLIW